MIFNGIFSNFMISVGRLALVVLPLLMPAAAYTPPPVPISYQDLFASMNTQINSFSATVNAGWNKVPYPVIYAAHLNRANSDLGPQLLGPNAYSQVLTELQEVQALGAKCVIINVSFPVLYPAYYSSPSEYQQYLSFYMQVVNAIRSKGLKLIVESKVVVLLPSVANWNPTSYFNSLTWQQYEAGRAQNAVIVAQNLKPDYLSILTEPDTEAASSGKSEVNTPSGATDLVNVILTALTQNGVKGVSVGAGVGTWLPSFQSFIQGLAATAVQFIDIHVYPVNDSFLPNALTIADMARAAGKQVAMTECWDSKERDAELNVLTSTEVYGRDPFSFWMPVDISFLQTMVNFAQYKQLLFMGPYWTQYFFANLDYNSVGALLPQQILLQEGFTGIQASSQGQFTPTGLAWKKMTVAGSDTQAPSVPANFAAQPGYGNMSLTWSASTDNVGVAGYKIFRDGTVLTMTSGPSYDDLALVAATTYTYAIAAFDASGNISAYKTIAATTLAGPDRTPPSVPVNVAARGVSTSRIHLSWSPSTDNQTVGGYLVYRGISPTSLSVYGKTSTNSFDDTQVLFSIPFYYTVAAYDVSGNYSAQSVMVSAAATTALVSCDLNGDGLINVVDVQLAINQALAIVACTTADVNLDGFCNVTDVQRIINAALGGVCQIGP
jgi:hypothetical protein